MALILKGKPLLFLASTTKTGVHQGSYVQKRCASFEPSQVIDSQEVPYGENSVATVFGANGNVGRMVVKYLAKGGAQVIAPYRGEERSSAFLKVMGEVGQIVPIRWEINDKKAIAMAVAEAKMVVNTCGRTWETKNFNFERANVESAENIAQACKDAGVQRLVHVSTVLAGRGSASKFVQAKEESEKRVKEIFPDATIVRITTPFGERDRFLFKFGYMMSKLPFFLLLADKHIKIQPVFTGDVARAIDAMLRDPRTKGKTYELAGPDVLTWEDFAKYVIKSTKYDGQKPILAFSPSSWVAKTIANIMNYSRTKIYSKDEIVYNSTDNVLTAGGNNNGFEAFGIKPRSLYDVATVFQLFKNKLRL